MRNVTAKSRTLEAELDFRYGPIAQRTSHKRERTLPKKEEPGGEALNLIAHIGAGIAPHTLAITRLSDANHARENWLPDTIESLSVSRGDMYNRTQNENGTYNTRCLYCFMTIESAVESEEELDRVEGRHICPERALAEMLTHAHPPASHPHLDD